MTAQSRNYMLDVLRGLAVLLILGRHFDLLGVGGANPIFAACVRFGWVGVDLFFVLSGFLISGLLFSDFCKNGSIGIARFYTRRAFKIYPPFYAFLLTTVAIMIWRSAQPLPWRAILVEFLFLQSYCAHIYPHTWSLAVEEHFYLLLPLLLTLMTRFRRKDPFALLLWVFPFAAVVDLGLRSAIEAAQFSKLSYQSHLHMDGLFFGVLLSYLHRFRPERFDTVARSRIIWWLAVPLLALLALYPAQHPLVYGPGVTVLYLVCGLGLAKVVGRQPAGWSRLITAPLAKLGVYTYSTYLWHPFLIMFAAPHVHVGPWIKAALYVVCSIAAGVLATLLVEGPALVCRDHWFPARSRSIQLARPTDEGPNPVDRT